jgi:hypothetical protein
MTHHIAAPRFGRRSWSSVIAANSPELLPGSEEFNEAARDFQHLLKIQMHGQPLRRW